ncbi:sigma-70 family RNA polymerase sigma factor [Phormidium sp. CLA17]|uniref:sigma-70 family RNA polymerase sigma factor n=1 Tax=Leptolyngbya sp. Cla-17 TaxID=2803751 RepID=UPI001491F55B|nr:sigma-70 family RNA polymerase sigma factor [Leptolyngbya sp. Cla-17]MBM0740875.1 sigma-70 family RNA polymerase sigma factor [Leptolyngbya sp. Cla-17]
MSELDQQLRELVIEACKHPPGSAPRQRNLTRVIRLVSPKLWRESVPYYQDAVQQTWVYFCKHICGSYNPELGSVPTWLNAFLKFRLLDFRNATQNDTITRVPSQTERDGELIDRIETIPAPPPTEPLLEIVENWARADVTGELKSLHIKGHPEINAQVLILRRLLSETKLKDLADEFGVTISTLSSFYQRQCLPRLRNFGESEGYIDSK